MKWLFGIILAVILIAGGFFGFIFGAYPNAGKPPEITASDDPDVIARGEYLVKHVAVCLDCHSDRDWTFYSGPVKEGTEGSGGERYTRDQGFPGEVYPANITPAALKSWTDSEIAHAIVSGIHKDGYVLSPAMPYASYNHLSLEDLTAIVSYLRSMPPLEGKKAERTLDFPYNIFMRMKAIPYNPPPSPNPGNVFEYGEYLAEISGCKSCHTQYENGEYTGKPYIGGRDFHLTDDVLVTSTNITPYGQKGIGHYPLAAWIELFKNRGDMEILAQVPKEDNTIMSWHSYAAMTESDLEALFQFLRSLEPIDIEYKKRRKIGESKSVEE